MPRTQRPFAEMGGVAEHNHGFCAHVRYRDEQGALNNIRGPDRRHRHDARKDLEDMRAAGAVGSTREKGLEINLYLQLSKHIGLVRTGRYVCSLLQLKHNARRPLHLK